MNLDFSAEVKEILEDYTDDVIEATNDSIDVSAKWARGQLKTNGEFKNISGNYRKGWSVKKERSVFGIRPQIVYNRTDYRLTHLLEFGHVNRDGSRTRKFPHIAPVEEQSTKMFISELEKRLKKWQKNNYIKA